MSTLPPKADIPLEIVGEIEGWAAEAIDIADTAPDLARVRANEMPASRQYDPENIDNRGRQPLLTKLEPMTLA